MADNIDELREQLEQEIAVLMTERRKRLNEAIRANNLTLVELEKRTGVAKSSIQRYLTGETVKIPIDFFEKIAAVTNVPKEYLACYDTDTDKTKNAPIETNQDDLTIVIKQLTGDDEKRVKEFAQLLLLKEQYQDEPNNQ